MSLAFISLSIGPSVNIFVFALLLKYHSEYFHESHSYVGHVMTMCHVKNESSPFNTL